MHALHEKPYPPKGPWHFVGKALASYWTGNAAEGDAAILGLKKEEQRQGSSDEDGAFHWRAFQIERTIFLFGRDGVFVAGRMSPEAERTAKEVLWEWLEPRARKVLVDPSKGWWIWGSENHHLQAWFSMWGAMQLFAKDPNYSARTFADGSRVSELKLGFDEYFKRWIRNRATRGLFVECGSPTYAKYSLSGFYNFVDFSDDAELRRLAKEFLDLCWAQWALEQVDGLRAGSRHRSYAGGSSTRQGAASDLAWFHFGTGAQSKHPASWCTATSGYTPPALVQDIVHRRSELGAYQITSRQPGLVKPGRVNFSDDPNYPLYSPRGLYEFDPTCPSMLRKTYATPGFILGATMVPALPQSAWAAFSSQNRWDGVIFAGKGSPRIFVQPQKPAKGSLYNTQWSVMEQGALIIQRLPDSNAKTSRVFFSKSLPRTERAGWIFVEAPEAYAAVKIVEGRWKWEPNAPSYCRGRFTPGLGEWLAPEKEFSPTVIEVSPKTAWPAFADFQNAILGNELQQSGSRLDYTSSFYKTTLTLFTDFKQPPLIQNRPVNYEPPKSFDGPVLQAEFGGRTVHLKALGQTHDFSFD